MSKKWGREETYRWPSDKPVWTITTLVLAVVAVIGSAAYQYQREWTELQRVYLKTYIATGTRTWMKSASYALVYRVEGTKRRAAVNDDLSDEAVLAGKVKLEWQRGVYNNAARRARRSRPRTQPG